MQRDVTGYLLDLMGCDYKETGNHLEYYTYCPFCHDHKTRFYLHPDKRVVHCFNCGYGQTYIKFMSDLLHIPYGEAYKIYIGFGEFVSLPQQILDEVLEQLGTEEYEKYIVKSPIPLPQEYIELDKSNSLMAKQVRSYLHSRLVTDEDITRHKFGYCYTGHYERRAILPIWENDSLQFWVARATTKNVSKFKKEMSPSNEDYQISKSEVIFNIEHAARTYGAAVLSEGIFDAVAYGDIGCALLGKAMSESQVSKILKYKYLLKKGIYLSLDEDAWKYTLRSAKILNQYLPVYIIKCTSDPNDMGYEGCMNALKNAKRYTPLFQVTGLLT